MRRWKRANRVYSFSGDWVQAFIFSAPPPFSMWHGLCGLRIHRLKESSTVWRGQGRRPTRH